MKTYNYIWSGVDESGRKISGEISAKNKIIAKILLIQKGVVVKKIRKKYQWHLLRQNHKVKSKHVTHFSRQIAMLLHAKVPLLQSLKTLEKSQNHLGYKSFIKEIIKNFEGGKSFSECLNEFPELFNKLYCDLVYVGEQSGLLDEILLKLADTKEKSEKLREKFLKAMLYPFIIMLVAFIVSAILLIYVVPNFQMLFDNFNAKLPWFTEFIISLSFFIKKNGLAMLLTMILIILITIILYKKSLKMHYYCQKLLIRLPLFGNLISYKHLTQLTTILATTLNVGMPLTHALALTEKTMVNPVYSEGISNITKNVIHGKSLYHAMCESNLFTEMTLQMIHIGEESHQLENMLQRIANDYEAHVDQMVANIATLCEPFIMLLLGIIIGSLVIAMYLPIFKLGTIV